MDIISILLRTGIAAAFFFIPDIFIISAIKNIFRNNPEKAKKIYWKWSIVLATISILIFILLQYTNENLARINLYFFGVFVSILFTKLLLGFLLFIESIIRILLSSFKYVKRKERNSNEKFLIGRRKFISKSLLFLSAIPFGGFMYGMFKGKYDFTLHEETIYFDDLPKSFDGINVIQLSDLHIGSWDKSAKDQLIYLVEFVQSLKGDLLLFTGDLVNSRAREMEGWYDIFEKLSAPLGKFSVLGNHDYGDYVNWDTELDKKNNLDAVKNIHPKIGFQLLLNENICIEKNEEKLFLLGVENWGAGDFPKFGDIEKAAHGISENAFKILLSHDPSHWDAKVLSSDNPPQLTLSGHTHGFQMGIEIPGFRFSPSQFIYEQWAGVYQKANKYIYVNRGLGTVGYPGRIGIWPEITKITLRKK